MALHSILITGSSGTVGTALAEELLSRGYEVTGIDKRPNPWSEAVDNRTTTVDLTGDLDPEPLPDNPDLVVHLAANARVHRLVRNPDLAKENFDTTYRILEYARETDASVLFSSSREVYGNNGRIVHSETDTYVDECESPYTASKIGGEALVKSYQECYGIDTSIVRFSNVYGKYDKSNRVIPLFISLANNDTDLTVYGEEKLLDFTYIDDCIAGVSDLIDQFYKASGTTFNIASGEGTSLIELAEIIIDELDSDSSIQIEENRTGEVSRFVADISKGQKLLGYNPEYDVERGLRATVDWYQSNPEVIDKVLSQR